MAEKIKIGGELDPRTPEKILGDASTIKDRAWETNHGDVVQTPNQKQDEINEYFQDQIDNIVATEQGGIQTDAAPTEGSVKLVQSGGVYTAIDNVAFSTSEKVNETAIATDTDFENPDTTKKEKLATVGSISDNFGKIVDNQEYVEVHTDNKDKILYGVKNDGDFYFGKGVPSQIQEEIDDTAATKVDKEDNKSLMTDAEHIKLEELPTNTELTNTIGDKVDKVTGKSLIDAEFATNVPSIISAEDGSEYIQATTDLNGKILEGITNDGKKVQNLPINTPISETFYTNNSEWIYVKHDEDDRVLYGIKKDGSFYTTQIQSDALVGSTFKINDFIVLSKNAQDDMQKRMGLYNHNYIPDYYFENGYLDDKLTEIRDAMATTNGISFGFFTDIHISKHLVYEDSSSTSGNAGYSPSLLKYIIDRLGIPFVLFGGDVPVVRTSSWEEIIGSGIKWHEMMSIIGKDKVFQTRGNHDYLGFPSISASSVRACTPKDLYPILLGDRHVYNINAPEEKMYYYFDVDNVNLRVIVLDDYGDKDTTASVSGASCIGQTQYDWLLNTALNCSNKNIILLSHQASDMELEKEINEEKYGSATIPSDVDGNRIILHEILSALKNKTMLSATSTDGNGTVTVSKDFTNDTNEFVVHLCGHRHVDASRKTDNVLNITHTLDCYSGYRPQGNVAGRNPNTITEQAFSIFSIDFNTKTIKMTRIGGGENNEWNY